VQGHHPGEDFARLHCLQEQAAGFATYTHPPPR
jgi:hypothetical protein